MTLPVSPEYAPHERLRVDLELTNSCNFRCPICPHSLSTGGNAAGAPFVRKRGLMSREVFERALDECQRVAGWVELGFFGEQTLHPHYLDYLDALKDRRFALELNSNMSMVTRETMEKWIDVGLDLARLSLDAIDPDVFDRARPGSVVDIDGNRAPDRRRVDVLEEKVAWWLARTDRGPTRIVFVDSSFNQGQLEPFVEHWTPHLRDGDVILAKRVLSYGGKMADERIGHHRCNVWENRFLMVDWRGDLTPCNLDTNLDLQIGNVMRESLHDAYTGAIANSLRRRTGCGNPLTPCSTCTDSNDWSGNREFGAVAVGAPGRAA